MDFALSDDDELFTKSYLLKALSENCPSFRIVVTSQNDWLINGMTGLVFDKTNNLVQFCDSIDNTKCYIVECLKKAIYLTKKWDKSPLFSEEKKLDPYRKDERYFPVEDATIRIGTIWDAFAHFCNIYYDVQVPAKRVSALSFFKEAGETNADLSPVKNYFLNEKSLFGKNAHLEIENLRNSLVHYCDLASQGFITKYFHDAREGTVLGQLDSMQLVISFLVFDLTSFFSYFYPIFSQWLSKIPDDTISMIKVGRPANFREPTILSLTPDESSCLHIKI